MPLRSPGAPVPRPRSVPHPDLRQPRSPPSARSPTQLQAAAGQASRPTTAPLSTLCLQRTLDRRGNHGGRARALSAGRDLGPKARRGWLMLTEVMRFYDLARPPVDAGFFETEHHAQVSRDIRAAIVGGRLIALTAVIGSGKTSRRAGCAPISSAKGGSSSRARCPRRCEDHRAAAGGGPVLRSDPRETV